MSEQKVTEVKKVRKRKREEHGEAVMAHDESNWLVSYADMMTLLFGFFVLLYSFSRIDTKKFEIVRKDVAKYFGGPVKVNPALKSLEQDAKDVLVNAGLEKSVELVSRGAEIELTFKGDLHFVPGSSTLNSVSQHALGKLIEMVRTRVKADSINVEGHTDDDPISSPVFPSNWELSASRASMVVREFEKFGFEPSKLTASGFGSSRPLAPNRDSKGIAIRENQELNRRVVVTVGFSNDVNLAATAMKTNEFVSKDSADKENEKYKIPLVRPGEGEQTWKEKVTREMTSVQEKLKLAEERLKETEERNQTAKQLSEMQTKLKQVELSIEAKEKEATALSRFPVRIQGRVPTSVKPKRKVKPAPQPSTQAAPVTNAPVAAPAAAPAVVPATAPATAPSVDLVTPPPAVRKN